jgi:inorganic pyrophosphatase
MHAWHDISAGNNAPEIVNSIIEIPKNSKAKFEIDKLTGLIKLDRVLYSSVHYPTNYGFIPQTLCDDGDPLDILVISTEILPSLCLVECKVIGAFNMTDQGKQDTKILAVPSNDVGFSHVEHYQDLRPHLLIEIRNFFEIYSNLENEVIVVGELFGPTAAYKMIEADMLKYQEKFIKKY